MINYYEVYAFDTFLTRLGQGQKSLWNLWNASQLLVTGGGIMFQYYTGIGPSQAGLKLSN